MSSVLIRKWNMLPRSKTIEGSLTNSHWTTTNIDLRPIISFTTNHPPNQREIENKKDCNKSIIKLSIKRCPHPIQHLQQWNCNKLNENVKQACLWSRDQHKTWNFIRILYVLCMHCNHLLFLCFGTGLIGWWMMVKVVVCGVCSCQSGYWPRGGGASCAANCGTLDECIHMVVVMVNGIWLMWILWRKSKFSLGVFR